MARFWRLQASISKGFGTDFSKMFDVFWAPLVRNCFLPASQIHSKVWANCSQNVGFHFPMCLQQCSPADASLQCMAVPQHSCPQMGRRRWPPPGGSQWNWLFGPQKISVQGLLSNVRINVFKNCVLEGSRLDFGGSGPRFGILRG